jgi:6-phosphogluconolactonase
MTHPLSYLSFPVWFSVAIARRNVARTMIKLLMCALFCSLAAAGAWADGAVYAMTNALGGNQIVVYHRASDGSLTLVQTIATGGGGSGLQLGGVDSLGSAGGLQLDAEHHFLFAVNANSASANNGAGAYNSDCEQGSITSFSVASDGTLTVVAQVSSGGLFPDSLTVKKIRRGNGDGDDANGGKLLYVLNAGGPGACSESPNVTGFRVSASGHMSSIGSTQPIDPGPSSAASGVSCLAATAQGFQNLTGAPAADFACGMNPPAFPRSPAQVKFTPDGNQLIVTVKGTNTIYVFPVDENGTADRPTITQAPGPALPSPFGLTFDKQEHMLVTELFGTATTLPKGGAGAVSSFTVTKSGELVSINSHVADGGTAACWIALEPIAGKYAYVSNNLSASISSYLVGSDGSLTLLQGAAATAAGPNDLATAEEGGASFLYAVEAGSGTVGAFQINLTNGSLIPLSAASGLPAHGAQGIAAF